MALAYPADFVASQDLISLPAWMLAGGLTQLIFGGLMGMASGFGVGLADALWRGWLQSRWRLVMGGLAGLVQSAYLIAFALMELFHPVAGPMVYVPVYIFYGVLVGLVTTFAIPRLGTRSPVRRQFVRALGAGAASALVTIPYVFLIYVDEATASLLSRLLYAFLLPFGIGLALSARRSGEARRSG